MIFYKISAKSYLKWQTASLSSERFHGDASLSSERSHGDASSTKKPQNILSFVSLQFETKVTIIIIMVKYVNNYQSRAAADRRKGSSSSSKQLSLMHSVDLQLMLQESVG